LTESGRALTSLLARTPSSGKPHLGVFRTCTSRSRRTSAR
jgi:hypothetical protein